MFWFGKKYKEQADKIGSALHEQIFGAMKVNEKLAEAKMETYFFVGYIDGFVSSGFVVLSGPRKQKVINKYVKYILLKSLVCGSSKLWEVYSRQRKYLDTGEFFLGNPLDGDVLTGLNVGHWDGLNLLSSLELASKTNLKSYLLDKELDYL